MEVSIYTLPTPSFSFAVNLGGNAATVNGKVWRSQAQAQANGLTITTDVLTSTTSSSTFVPAATGGTICITFT